MQWRYVGAKVELPCNRPRRPTGWAEVQLYSFFNLGARWECVCGRRHASAALPPGVTRYPIYRRLGGPPGSVWTGAGKYCTPPGLDPRTLHPVASRSTDWAITAHCIWDIGGIAARSLMPVLNRAGLAKFLRALAQIRYKFRRILFAWPWEFLRSWESSVIIINYRIIIINVKYNYYISN